MINDSNVFYIYMENRIIESIQKYCQWKLHLQLLDSICENELKKLDEIIQPELLEQIKKHAPLHYKHMSSYLFGFLTNDLWDARFRDEEVLKMNPKMPDKACYWSTITDSELKAYGFDEQFTKKEISVLVENKKLRKKKGTLGNKYSLHDPDSISQRIKYVKAGIRFGGDGYTDLLFDEAWIYEQFSKESIDSQFENIKSIVFEKIKNGIVLNDDVD